MTVQRVPVVSEAVRSIGYEGSTLEVEFADGDVYRYFEVPEAVYGEMMLAESVESTARRSRPTRSISSTRCTW